MFIYILLYDLEFAVYTVQNGECCERNVAEDNYKLFNCESQRSHFVVISVKIKERLYKIKFSNFYTIVFVANFRLP